MHCAALKLQQLQHDSAVQHMLGDGSIAPDSFALLTALLCWLGTFSLGAMCFDLRLVFD